MRIIISSDGRDLGSNIDATFHRCSFFLILDTEKNTQMALENTTKDRTGEIGATIGQIVSNKGADIVITANIGPKKFEIFERYGINIFLSSMMFFIDQQFVSQAIIKRKLDQIHRKELVDMTESEQNKS